MVSPRYCKSTPFNFTMRFSYRRSILVSCALNDSILIRKELRCARYVGFPFTFHRSSFRYRDHKQIRSTRKASDLSLLRVFSSTLLWEHRAIVNTLDSIRTLSVINSPCYRWSDARICFRRIFNVNSPVKSTDRLIEAPSRIIILSYKLQGFSIIFIRQSRAISHFVGGNLFSRRDKAVPLSNLQSLTIRFLSFYVSNIILFYFYYYCHSCRDIQT